MVHVYLVYGLAFILLATVTAFQAGTSVRILPNLAMIFLGLFGVLHGSAEWVEIAKYFPEVRLERIQLLSSGLVATSFIALFAFGTELVITYRRLPKVARAGTLLMLVLAWGFARLSTGPLASGAPLYTAYDISARYFLGFPGALLACVGLHDAARAHRGQLEYRLRSRLRWAGAFFALYAVFAGLIVPEAPIGFAGVLNTGLFRERLGFPVVFLRTACALSISMALVQAFVVEISRINSLWGRMREEFISLVAHDLKSSLSGVRLASELLVEELPQGKESPERLDKIARQILSTTNSLARIVGDLLDASLIAANRLTIRRQNVDFGELVSAAVERARPEFEYTELRWQPPAVKVMAPLDPVRVDQVLLNLFSNARKYSKPGTPVIVSLTQRNARAVLVVSNQAENVDVSELPMLFERYYRRKSTEGRSQGSGLGLYIVKGLVEAHGGEVGVKALAENEIGFFVSFPQS